MTATTPTPHKPRTAVCIRCGITRQTNGTRTGRLCKDCSGGMTRSERKVWNG